MAVDDRTASRSDLHDAVRRARAEFLEMSGLQLTAQQAQRLWTLDHGLCEAVMHELLSARFLKRSGATRTYATTGDKEEFAESPCASRTSITSVWFDQSSLSSPPRPVADGRFKREAESTEDTVDGRLLMSSPPTAHGPFPFLTSNSRTTFRTARSVSSAPFVE